MATHDCKQVLNKVRLALDGELTDAEEKALADELNKCDCCLEHYEIEESFKKFICDKIKRKEVSVSLIQEIRNNIQASV